MKNIKKEQQSCSLTNIRIISIEQIDFNPYQPRKIFDEDSLTQLSKSISTHGLLQPITVKNDGERYTLIAGERRLRATIMAKINTINAIVLDSNQLEELAIIENVQRENLNTFELSRVCKSLEIQGKTQQEISNIINTNRSTVTKYNALNMFDDEQIEFCITNKYTALENLYLLSTIKDEPNFEELFKIIVVANMSVNEIRQMIKNTKEEINNQVNILEEIDEEEKTPKNFPKIQTNQITLDKKDPENLRMFIKINELSTDEYRELLLIVFKFFKIDGLDIFLTEEQKAFKKGGVK